MALHTFDDAVLVREYWFTVLTAARKAGVDFHVNDGARTIAMQWERVRKHGLYSASNPTGAAYPSEGAPHINYEQENHAIDSNGADALVTWLRREGAPSADTPLGTEPWHIQIDLAELTRLYLKFRDPYHGLSQMERRNCQRHDFLRSVVPKGKTTPEIGRLRKWFYLRRKALWLSAQKKGITAAQRKAYLARWREMRKRSPLTMKES